MHIFLCPMKTYGSNQAPPISFPDDFFRFIHKYVTFSVSYYLYNLSPVSPWLYEFKYRRLFVFCSWYQNHLRCRNTKTNLAFCQTLTCFVGSLVMRRNEAFHKHQLWSDSFIISLDYYQRQLVCHLVLSPLLKRLHFLLLFLSPSSCPINTSPLNGYMMCIFNVSNAACGALECLLYTRPCRCLKSCTQIAVRSYIWCI